MESISPSRSPIASLAPTTAALPRAANRASSERPQVAQARDHFARPGIGGAAQAAGGTARPCAEGPYSRALPPGLSRDTYSPSRWGWHDYQVDHIVAPAGMRVTADQMRDYLLRHAVPGQDPSQPVRNGQVSVARDPRLGWRQLQGLVSGLRGQQDRVRTEISNDGLTISNRTLPGHSLHDGRIVRTAYQDGQGNWHIRTHGYGNNEGGFPLGLTRAGINQLQGPQIFTAVDQGMAWDIRRQHAS